MKTKKFKVNFDMRWSYDFIVSATSKPEAKKKAFKKLKTKLSPSMFNVSSESE